MDWARVDKDCLALANIYLCIHSLEKNPLGKYAKDYQMHQAPSQQAGQICQNLGREPVNGCHPIPKV